MEREAATSSIQAIPEGQGGSASSVAQQEGLSAAPTSAALIAFAEEFGRMLACQLLTDPNRRRGYCLPEGMAGLAIDAVMVLLTYYMLCWVRY